MQSNIPEPAVKIPQAPNSKPFSSYQNLAAIAKTSGKQLGHWMNYPVGKTAIAQFKASHPEIAEPIITVRGRGKAQGTYAHPSLAAIFAAWCNPQFTAKLSDEVLRQRDCMKALQAKNGNNVYDLEASKDFDDRLQYLIDAGFSYEQMAAMKPVPVKKGHCGWVVEGEFAVEIAKNFELPVDEYCNRKRAVIGPAKFNQKQGYSVTSPLGCTISEIGVTFAKAGYCAYIWGRNLGE